MNDYLYAAVIMKEITVIQYRICKRWSLA